MRDNLGNRMKGYEGVSRYYLTKRMPTIIRIDGKSFHTLTRKFNKPFDYVLINTMWATAKSLCEQISGCRIAYVQSDEISLLLTDYEKIETQAWFEKNMQKMVSVSASIATLNFNTNFRNIAHMLSESKAQLEKYAQKFDVALFDSRVFVLPKEEVCNYFIWRQQDAIRNAIQMAGQTSFSHKQLQNRSCQHIVDMLLTEKDIDFNGFSVPQRRGACIVQEQYEVGNAIRNRWVVDSETPVFVENRNYIEKYL